MRRPITILFLIFVAISAACDVRSETAKREMEKFTSSPTPPISPTPTSEPLNEADIANVDTALQGDMISINGYEQKTSANCTKFNRFMVNGDKNVITIKGVCRQVMINGDNNKITADAAMEYVMNGIENTVTYSRLANGKRPSVVQNKSGNIIEKVPATDKK